MINGGPREAAQAAETGQVLLSPHNNKQDQTNNNSVSAVAGRQRRPAAHAADHTTKLVSCRRSARGAGRWSVFVLCRCTLL